MPTNSTKSNNVSQAGIGGGVVTHVWNERNTGGFQGKSRHKIFLFRSLDKNPYIHSELVTGRQNNQNSNVAPCNWGINVSNCELSKCLVIRSV